MRVAVLDDYQRVAPTVAGWPGDTVFFDAPLADLEALKLFDTLVVMRERTAFPREVLERLPNLKLLVTTGMRNAAVDIDYLLERGVTVCGTGIQGYGRSERGISSTVEIAWGLILAVTKRITQEDAAIRRGVWQDGLPRNLGGRTLGLVGLGRLGGQMVAPARAFSMEVQAWSANLTDERAQEAGATRADSLAALLASSDIVSIHLVLSERTRGLLGAAELAQMKPGAVLINTSRGPIVDEQALISGLRAGKPAAAGLDVFDREPLPPGHPLTELPNTVLTPHLGYATAEGLALMYAQCIEDLGAYAAGAPIRLIG